MLKIALVAFALRAVVPVGFMPAPVAEGGPIVLCPGGSGGALVRLLSGHATDHAVHHHDPDSYDAWSFCPIGAALTAMAPTAAIEFQLPVFEHVLSPQETPTLRDRVASRPYQARAPPQG